MTTLPLTMNTRPVGLTIPLVMAWFQANETKSLYLFFPGFHSKEVCTFVTAVFSLTIDADCSFSEFLIFGRFCNRYQCVSSSFGFPDVLSCGPQASNCMLIVIFGGTMSLSIFPVCYVSVRRIS